MDVLGIDITSLPWPMFISVILAFFGGLWYINSHLPLVEKYDLEKEENAKNIEEMKKLLEDFRDDMRALSSTLSSAISQNYNTSVEISSTVDVIKDMAVNEERRSVEEEHIEQEKYNTIKHGIDVLSEKLQDVKEAVNHVSQFEQRTASSRRSNRYDS